MEKEIRISRAWLVTYMSYNRYKKLNGKVLSVLKWQKSPNQVAEHITQLYVDNWLYPSERISFLKNRHYEGLAYKPVCTKKGGKVVIIIGHDPQLKARQVKNLKVTINESTKEKLTWIEI